MLENTPTSPTPASPADLDALNFHLSALDFGPSDKDAILATAQKFPDFCTWARQCNRLALDNWLECQDDQPELIYVYTRSQALEDGVLIDLNQVIPLRESGYKYPVACTTAVWAIIEKTAKGRGASDHAGIVWDILHMSRFAIVRRWETGNLFRVKIGRKWHTLKIECGPGDDLAPVLTVLCENED